MENFYNIYKLVSLFKEYANIPDYDRVVTNQKITDMLNEEMYTVIAPFLLTLKEDYFLFDKKYTTNKTGSYRVPERSLGLALKNVYIDDGNGNCIQPLTQIDSADREDLSLGSNTYANYFYIKGNYIVVNYNDFLPGILNAEYFLKPNRLTYMNNPNQTEAKILEIIDETTIKVNKLPFNTSADPGQKYDILKDAIGREQIQIDLVSSYVTLDSPNYIIGFSEKISNKVEVGDFLTVQNLTSSPQLPEEFCSLLVLSAAQKYVEDQPDKSTLELILNRKKDIELRIEKVYGKRVSNKTRKLRNTPFRWGF